MLLPRRFGPHSGGILTDSLPTIPRDLYMGHGFLFQVPEPVNLVNLVLSVLYLCVCFYLIITRFVWRWRSWSTWSLLQWTVLVTLVNAFLFVYTAVAVEFGGYDIDISKPACQALNITCDISYTVAKGAMSWFLVERAHAIRSHRKKRYKSKHYIFTFGTSVALTVILWVLAFAFNHKPINDDEVCIIFIKTDFVMPAIILEVLCNVYLTAFFLTPFAKLHILKVKLNWSSMMMSLRRTDSPITNAGERLRRLAIRSFLGSSGLLILVILNVGPSIALERVSAWFCLFLCKTEAAVGAVILAWVISVDE